MWVIFAIVFVILVIGVVILQLNQQKNTSSVVTSVPINRNSPPKKLNNYSYNIVGEQSYQKNLEKIAGRKEEQSKKFECSARVISEPTNKYDKNAVKVEINGLLVGYLSKDEALKLKNIKVNKTVPALINGGWNNDDGEGSYGVKLAINTISDLF